MMNEIIIYLYKVSLGVGIVSISYLLLRNDSNLVIKRFYLLFGIIASWVFPFLPFPQLVNFTSTAPFSVPASSITVETAGIEAVAPANSSVHINWLNIIIMIYSAGVLIIFLRNIFLVSRWRMRYGKKDNESNIVFTDSDQVFTLFSWIFLPERYRNDPRVEPIILHEKAHINQMHFIDLILVELTVLFTWFNPFTWLISRMIKENHEHLADREVLAGGINPAHYRAQLLNFSLGTTYFRLGHQFNHSLTKTRFKMMKRTAKKRIGIFKYILIIPVIIIALGVLTGSELQDRDGSVKGKVVFGDTGKPATGASIIVKGTTNGTTADIDGSFVLECEKDDILVISYVGYETLEMKASWITERPIKLEFSSYELDLTEVKENKRIAIQISESDNLKIEPVIIVGGKVVESMDNIDPDDIWSVEVIKDQNSEVAKKFKAKNGVVIITLKETMKEKEENKTKPSSRAESTEEIFIVVEDMPEFPGGLSSLKSYIYDNLEYPENAKQEGIEGKVTVEFTINKEGKVEDEHVLRSTYQGFDNAALKVFRNMPDWEPGRQRGTAVRVRLRVPVEFKLDKE